MGGYFSMAKTIKFNLFLDENPVRNIEGIQENFSIEDMLKYFKNGLLERWLEVRGYDDYLEKVKGIDPSGTNKEIIIELIKIFDIAINNDDVEKGIAILDYLAEANKLNLEYKENAKGKQQIIEDYHLGYSLLIEDMESHKDDMAILKADVMELEKEYRGLFELDFYSLFFRLSKSAPKAIFAILTRDFFRKFWIDESAETRIYNAVKAMLTPVKLKEILEDDLKIEKRDTQSGWDTIELPEKKIMVLRIENNSFVRNCDDRLEKLSYTDVNEKMLKFNGLDYQCNDKNIELLYMEV